MLLAQVNLYFGTKKLLADDMSRVLVDPDFQSINSFIKCFVYVE